VYTPPIYRDESDTRIRDIVEGHPLAVLVTNGPTMPFSTHLPIVTPAGAAQDGPLAGSVVLGHLNRANPHWNALRPGTAGRLIFSGPSSYITPTVYHTTPAAPTWNFVAVHLLGRVEPIDGLDGTLKVVERTADVFEGRFGAGWRQEHSREYFRQIGPGVGAFRFHVESAASMFKLSQEKDEDIRKRVIDWLGDCTRGAARDLATVMRTYPFPDR
jgi:transcriptional regulator